MRIPSRWLTRPAQHLFCLNSHRVPLSPAISQHTSSHFSFPPRGRPRNRAYHATHLTRLPRTHNTTTNLQAQELLKYASDATTTNSGRSQGLPRWIHRLNEHLPPELRILEDGSLHVKDIGLARNFDAESLEKVFASAQKEGDVDLLPWLVEKGYRKTAVWLMQAILSLSSSKSNIPTLRVPSNIVWPENIFKSIKFKPVKTSRISEPPTKPVDINIHFGDREVSATARLLTDVWTSLGVLIVNSAQKIADDTTDDNMLTVLLVLAHVHNVGMMPDNVYAYTHLPRTTHVQRPPILNLVSGRILAALSDVTWRQQQDDAIALATRMGMSIKDLSNNAPGGRFRLKVRPLAPEIWLELILWCCIESNQTTAALSIIARLTQEAENPWFAMRWTSPQARDSDRSLIDWDRVKLRHGGAAGSIEGYSREEPFVHVPDKTISVEVVLALVDKLLSSLVSSSLIHTGKVEPLRARKDLRRLRRTMADIESVMAFLEPHDLPPDYFDYLESRLLQQDAFDLRHAPVDLYRWTKRMRSIRDLKRVSPERKFEQSLRLDSIQMQSQLHVGMQHQALNALIEFGDVHNTLALFNEMQESVDEKKVASIKSFWKRQQQLQMASTKEIASFSPKHHLEFTNCHGQLPYYKLAGLLNLISDTNLIGLGRWLLYAEEVDGAALPEHVWDLPCMTNALYRFAAVSQDKDLLETAMAKGSRKLLPSIKTLRALADADMSLLHFRRVRMTLKTLKDASGGGFGLSNVANLAATLLRLEESNTDNDAALQRNATFMLKDMLIEGRYDSRRNEFTLQAKRNFKQQIHHMLTVFLCFPSTTIGKFARRYRAMFSPSNLPVLPARDFNVILSAAIEIYGAGFGRTMWERFCTNPDTPDPTKTFDVEHNPDDDRDAEIQPSNVPRPASRMNAGSLQHDQLDPDNELLQFDDPFFPKQRAALDDSFHKALTAEEQFQSSSSRQRDTSPPSQWPPYPLVIPNLNTLRVIIRGTVRELQSRDEAGLSAKSQERQLAWAVQILRLFGIADRSVIEQEIQLPLAELDTEYLAEANREIESRWQRVAQPFSGTNPQVDESVSEMWLPISRGTVSIANYG